MIKLKMLPTTATVEVNQKKWNAKDFLFKTYVIISMTLIWSSYTLLLRYTRISVKSEDLYFSTTVVFLAESNKFCISIVCLWMSCGYSFAQTKDTVETEFLNKPKELLKMSVPSIVYAVQNNLDFVALSNLDPGVYQVTTQLKVVTTALFMVVMLGRKYSGTRWLSIIMLFVGVALVQLQAVNEQKTKVNLDKSENYLLGLIAVLTTCVTAGFAGVYFEKMLKDGTETPFWIRNLQMYTCGIVSSGFGCLLSESNKISQKGFFYGYDFKVWIIVGLLSLGGIYISLVMKHLDNLLKSFASAVSILLIFIASLYLFGTSLGFYFALGTFIVCSAILLYNSVPE